ncbi:unnamed protein product [Caenorhabditis auriculariae]|uniref:Uncharacterized protein n=1 Tax=Caenorhabditis auriculariae TaxID=2777116 RepID=A0A8S1H1K6_9PELO|nr:unnamed protein product [Caenorhabditis auriculariae]
MTSVRIPKDDAEAQLLVESDNENESPKRTAQQSSQFWPRDLIGVNMSAKMGTVAAERVSIRINFLRKVLGIVSFQLLLTIGICTAIYCTPGSKDFLKAQSWIVFPSLFVSIGLLIGLHVNAHEVPINYVLLAAFTSVQALTLGCIVVLFQVQVILEAAITTMLVVFGLFMYTLQSKKDFSVGYATSFSLLGCLLAASFVQIFVMSSAFNFILNVFGAGVFCVLLVLDLDAIMMRMSPEDYILACIALYMDIINLFVRILQILGEGSK